MNSLFEKAHAQSGQELLSGKLDPSFYATVLAEASGNVAKAMGLYAERRAASIYAKLLQDDERAKKRLNAMAWQSKNRSPMKREVDLLRPLLLLLAVFLGTVSVLLCLCGMKDGEICAMGVLKVAITAFVVTALCFTTAIWIRRTFRKVSFLTAMMPFAILLALGSLGAGTLVIKNSYTVSWDRSGMNEGATVELSR